MEKKGKGVGAGEGKYFSEEVEWLAGNSSMRPGLLANLQIIQLPPTFPAPEGKPEQPE